MALSDFDPKPVNTDGSPLLLTTTDQELYLVPDGEMHELDFLAYNQTTSPAYAYWKYKASGIYIKVLIPANGSPFRAVPSRAFLGVGSSGKLYMKADALNTIVISPNANRLK